MHEWARMRWPEVPAAVAENPVALLPFGAIEEHGPHMVVGADWLAAERLARRIAERANLLLLPALPYGQVWSLGRFPGSISISDETLIQLVMEIGAGLKRNNVRGLILLSGHLGNVSALKKASRKLLEDAVMPSISLFYPGLEHASKVAKTPRSHPTLIHSDEIETSLLLALAPEAVDMSLAVSEYPEYPPDFDYSPLYWDEVSQSGVFGDSRAATAEEGEAIIQSVVEESLRIIKSWKERFGI